MRTSTAFVAVALLTSAGLAQALTVTYTSNTVGLTTTDWSDTLTLKQFNPSLGALQGITFELFGEVKGNARAESLDAQPATLTLKLGADLTLFRPDLSTLVVAIPVVNNTFLASTYDGTVDWGGTSGVAFLNIGATQSNSASYSSAADLLLFTGTGNVIAPLHASANSTVSGAGNLGSFFDTTAGGYAKVTYTYTSAVPEPETWAMMLAGIGAIGALSVRRRRES